MDYADDINVYKSSGLSKLISQVKDTKDLYYIVLMMIQASKDNPENTSILPEMLLIMDEVSVMNLIWYFSGETIEVPTVDEVRDYLQALLLYYYYDVKGEDWKDCFTILGVDYNRTESARLIRARKRLQNDLKSIKFPREV